MIDKNFGKRVQQKRKSIGLNCSELAEKCFVNEGYKADRGGECAQYPISGSIV